MARPLAAPKRLLVMRLDRIGDVALSTPVLGAARRSWPQAFIGMMVRSACRDVVAGHPAADLVIAYDKEERHKSAAATFGFALGLRRHGFDTALILHPTNRAHWIARLAGIPRRIGYDRKQPWLLTHRVPHRKQEGSMHEAQYALDMLRVFGIEPGDPQALVAVDPAARDRVARLLLASGITDQELIVAIHPSASCISKRWMPDRFAAVADRLSAECSARIVIVAGAEDRTVAESVARRMNRPYVNLAGSLSVAELIALLARSRLLVSNDSGPVHLAAAVGTPVVDIFGRNQAGLSPRRWGPLGQGHAILHKEVGCEVCLAHACQIQFKCLTELAVDEVFEAAKSALGAGKRFL